ncbi:MAG: hypothetical protein R3C15_19785 [Thermoleophilia bacterium]
MTAGELAVELPRHDDAVALAAALAERGITAELDGRVLHVDGAACAPEALGRALEDWLAEAPEPLLVPQRIDERSWALRPPLA